MLGSLTLRWPDGRRRVQAVVAARIDFLQQLEAFPYIATAWETTQFHVPPMPRDALRQVISAPLGGLKGIRFAGGLADQILHDTPIGPGALPLLEYTLTELWKRQQRGIITTAAYRDLGGVEGALARSAERVLWARADASERRAVERVFIQMIRPGEQLDAGRRAPDTRRVASRDEFDDADWNLVHRLASTRLVVITRQPAGPDTVELAHEALIGAWPRMAAWVDENREFRIWQESLRRTMRQWGDHDQHAKYLLDGPHLARARDWAQRRWPDLTPAERAFIGSSSTAAARRQRRRRYGYGVTAVAAVLAAVASLLAVMNGHTAVNRQRNILSGNFATESENAVSTNLASADLYGLAAWQAAHTEQSRTSLLSRGADPYLGSFAEPAQFIVADMAISPDGRLLAVSGTPDQRSARRDSVQLWDIATRRLLAAFSTPDPARTVAFSPDGSTLAAAPATSSGSLRVWSVATHRELPEPGRRNGRDHLDRLSPDGRLLAVGELIPPYSRNGRPLAPADLAAVIDLWDLTTYRMVRRLGGLTGPIWSLDFSDDGRLLASGGNDHTARLWDTATGRERAVLAGIAAPVEAVRFEPGGGRILATGGADGTIRVWNAVTGAPYLKLHTSGAATAFAFSPGWPYLYMDLDLTDVSRVDLLTGNEAGDPIRLQRPVTQMAVSPDGRILVLGGPEGSLSALDIEGRTFYSPDPSPLTAAAVDRSGQLAATAATDGTVQLWPVSDPAAVVTLRAGADPDLIGAAFSPAGLRLAVGDAGCHVTIWDFRGAKQSNA